VSSDEHDASVRDPDRDADPNSERRASDADEWWVDRFILYSARESMLWALGLVVVGHFAVFIASVVLVAIRSAHPLGVSISLLLLAGTGLGVRAEIRRKGRPAGLTWLLLATWLLSGILAYVGDRYHLL